MPRQSLKISESEGARMPIGRNDGGVAHSANLPRVLLVEDDENLAVALTVGLRSAGHAVSRASDGSGFIDLIASVRPDLALLDVSLPTGPNGFELARTFRNSSDAPIIFLTASD